VTRFLIFSATFTAFLRDLFVVKNSNPLTAKSAKKCRKDRKEKRTARFTPFVQKLTIRPLPH
jgi:hypothetical protein